jgi:hypothetical protein
MLETLHQEIVAAVNSPTGQEAFAKQRMRPVPTASPADAKSWLQAEKELWEKIVAEVKIDLAD